MNQQGKKLKRRDLLFAAGIFLISFLLFLPSVRFDADVFDDFFYLHFLNVDRMPEFFSFIMTPVLGLRSPLVQSTFFVERLLWGRQLLPHAVHLTNILCHAAGAVLLYFLCRKLRIRTEGKSMRLSPLWSTAAALIWACHPQRVESVVWVAERKDVLIAIFFFSTILLLIRAIRKNTMGISALCLFLISFTIKPMLITFPFVVLFLLKIETGRFFSKRNFKYLLLYILTGIPILCYLMQQTAAATSPHWQGRIAVIFLNIGNYFKRRAGCTQHNRRSAYFRLNIYQRAA